MRAEVAGSEERCAGRRAGERRRRAQQCRLGLFPTLVLAVFALGTLAQATGGLPTVSGIQGRYSEQALLEANPQIQEAYVAGVLDALMLVYAEGEAFAGDGMDPRNAYALLHEAVAHVPGELPAGAIREVVVESLRAKAGDQSAALTVWRTLVLNRCCWAR